MKKLLDFKIYTKSSIYCLFGNFDFFNKKITFKFTLKIMDFLGFKSKIENL